MTERRQRLRRAAHGAFFAGVFSALYAGTIAGAVLLNEVLRRLHLESADEWTFPERSEGVWFGMVAGGLLPWLGALIFMMRWHQEERTDADRWWRETFFQALAAKGAAALALGMSCLMAWCGGWIARWIDGFNGVFAMPSRQWEWTFAGAIALGMTVSAAVFGAMEGARPRHR